VPIFLTLCAHTCLLFRSQFQCSVLARAIIVCAIATLKLKSSLGVGPKVKDSIEDPFR